MSKYKAPVAVGLLIGAMLIGMALVAQKMSSEADPAGSGAATYKPIPAEDVARLDKDGAHFTPDEAATTADPDGSARAVSAAVGMLGFLSEEQVAYVSLGDATLDEVPKFREGARVWVVLLHDFEVPKLGGMEGDDKPSTEEFYVVVDANTMTGVYGGTFNEGI